MKIGEGIVYGDILVENEDLFIDFFTKYYQANDQVINIIIKNLMSEISQLNTIFSLGQYNASFLLPDNLINNFEDSYKRFQREILLNTKPTSLLVGYRSDSGKTVKYHHVEDINKQIGFDAYQYGIETKMDTEIKNMRRYRKAQTTEYFLQQHYNELLKFLENKIGKQDASNLSIYHKSTLKGKKYSGLSDETWHKVFYGNRFKANYIGNVQDSFLNHVANYETSIFKFLISQGQMSDSVEDTINTLIKIATSVYQEERGVSPSGHFAELLDESKNTTRWFASGDILIVGFNREIIYNIQLKTTSFKKPSNFEIKLKELEDILQEFQQINNPVEKAKILFKKLKTQVSNINELNNAPNNDIDELIKTTLMEKTKELNIDII